jgi:Sulfotransferase domain
MLTDDLLEMIDIEELNKLSQPKYENLEQQTTRRFIKTHLPLSLLPRNIKEVGAKVVYVARNPKDVAASYYNFHKTVLFLSFDGAFKSFLRYFMNDLSKFPYFTQFLLFQ